MGLVSYPVGAENQDFFLHKGVYMLFEKLKLLAYRNLFFRFYKLSGESFKISVTDLTKLVSSLGVDMGINEMECILANLIYRGFIKGYISHSHKKLVVSKTNPFPPVKGVVRNAWYK